MFSSKIRNSWFSNTRADVLSGITVALALIPEAIAFSIIAGVDPMVGLYASFSMAFVISFAGGRPAMISAATGAMALLMVGLVKEHGVEYLFAATILTGIIQFVFGILKVGKFITFVPHSVMTGFVNALAILIFTAQLPHFAGQGWQMYLLVGVTLLIIYLLPRFTKAIPSALAAIILVTIFTVTMGWDHLKTVGDMGELSSTLPVFHLPAIPINLETLWIILPYSLSLAVVGILESLLTATIVDEMTDTKSNKNTEVRGQGIANFVTGFFGGMAGCAMIGQSVINVKSGGRTRLSTFVAGVFLLFLIIVASPVVKVIPMAALVGVMFMVSIGTFDWSSLKNILKIPRADALIMVVTVAIVVATHDLSKGVLAGVILSAIVFAWKMAKIRSSVSETSKGKTYVISGQMFFGTMNHFVDLFDFESDPKHVTIDFSHSHVWDQSAAVGIAKVVLKYQQLDKKVEITGLNEESRILVDKVGLNSVSGH